MANNIIASRPLTYLLIVVNPMDLFPFNRDLAMSVPCHVPSNALIKRPTIHRAVAIDVPNNLAHTVVNVTGTNP